MKRLFLIWLVMLPLHAGAGPLEEALAIVVAKSETIQAKQRILGLNTADTREWPPENDARFGQHVGAGMGEPTGSDGNGNIFGDAVRCNADSFI